MKCITQRAEVGGVGGPGHVAEEEDGEAQRQGPEGLPHRSSEEEGDGGHRPGERPERVVGPGGRRQAPPASLRRTIQTYAVAGKAGPEHMHVTQFNVWALV